MSQDQVRKTSIRTILWSSALCAILLPGCATQSVKLQSKQSPTQPVQTLSPQQKQLAQLLIYKVDTKEKSEYDEDIIYQGVMTIHGDIIVPAYYDEVMLSPFPEPTKGGVTYEIIATGGKYRENLMADVYDFDGKRLEQDMLFPFFSGSSIRPYIITMKKDISLEDIEDALTKKLEGIDDEDKKESIIRHLIIPNIFDLLNIRTQKRVPIGDKNIYRLVKEYSPFLLKHNMLLAISGETGLIGIIDTDANWVVPAQYPNSSIDKFLPASLIKVIDNSHSKDEFFNCHSFLSIDRQANPPQATDLKVVGNFSHFERFMKASFDNQYYSRAQACNADSFDSNYGLLDQTGEWVIKPQDDMQLISLPDSQGLVTFQNTTTKAVGSMNLQGDIVVPAKFFRPKLDEMSWKGETASTEFDQYGLMAVRDVLDSEDYGFINVQSDWVIPPTHTPKLKTNNYNSYAFDQYGFAHTYLQTPKGQLRVINLKGDDVYESLPGTITEFNDSGFAPYMAPDGKLGVINLKGDIVTKPQFDNSLHKLYHHNEIAIEVNNKSQEGSFEKGDFEKGDVEKGNLEEGRTEQVSTELEESEDYHSLVGVMDHQGKVVVPPQYKEVIIDKDYAIVETVDGKYGVIDYEQKVLLPPQPYPIRQLVHGSSIMFDAIYMPQGDMFAD